MATTNILHSGGISLQIYETKRGRPRIYQNGTERLRAWRARQRQGQQEAAKAHKDEWATPRWLFDECHAEWGLTLDVCASAQNTKCARYYTSAENGLIQPWEGVCWCNPPYSRGQIKAWLAKAVTSAEAGATVVCLLPVSTSTGWWQQWVLPYAEIRYLPKRITFVGAPAPARFDSALVIFTPQKGPA